MSGSTEHMKIKKIYIRKNCRIWEKGKLLIQPQLNDVDDCDIEFIETKGLYSSSDDLIERNLFKFFILWHCINCYQTLEKKSLKNQK